MLVAQLHSKDKPLNTPLAATQSRLPLAKGKR